MQWRLRDRHLVPAFVTCYDRTSLGTSPANFLQPFDPEKTPVVLIHGLMSTPRMWKPVLDGLCWRRFANITRFGPFITRQDSLFRSPLCSSGKR